jgi:hypothetical protein
MLDLSVSNQEIKINGYDIVRKDRNRHGGEVAIHKNLNKLHSKRRFN